MEQETKEIILKKHYTISEVPRARPLPGEGVKSKCHRKSSQNKFSGRSRKIDFFFLFASTYRPKVDMKCDIVFFRLKRLRFHKIKKNEFRPHYCKIGRMQRLKIGNLDSICVRLSKRSETSRYFCLKDKVFSYQKQAITCLEPPSRTENPEMLKNCFCLHS